MPDTPVYQDVHAWAVQHVDAPHLWEEERESKYIV